MYVRFILTLSSFFFLMSVTSTALARDMSALSTIEVVGKAQIMVAPNVASISFAVETNDPQAQQAVKKNAGRTENLLSVLKKIAGKKTNIRTSGFSVSPVYEKGERLNPKGYRAVNTVILETKELDKLGAFIDEASKAGANRFGSLVFKNDREEEFKREAAIQALSQAMKNAESLAVGAGLGIKRVIKITYGPRDIPAFRQHAVQYQEGASRTPVEIGQIPIDASVNVTLEIN